MDIVLDKKEIFPKGPLHQCKVNVIQVIMNNFVLNNVEVDYFNPTSNDFSMSFFKNFHGKISSVLVFTSNLAK